MSLDNEDMNAAQMDLGISPEESEDDFPENDEDDDDDFDEAEERLARDPTRLGINGNIVNFPQRHVNERHSEVLEGCLFNLRHRKHSFIECPSDKERRLSLLTSLLANYQYQIHGENGQAEILHVPIDGEGPSSPSSSVSSSAFSSKSKIYFACRSFEEMNQVIHDLKCFRYTGYLENLTMAVLAHPNQLCDHCDDDDVLTCLLPRTSSEAGYSFIEANGAVHDLNHLKKKGRWAKFCPYKFNKELSKQADLVICLQQFILSSTHRTKYCISPENSIFIFDDGSNIETACYDVASILMRAFEFKSAGLMMGKIQNSFEENEGNQSEVALSLKRLAGNLNALSVTIDTQAKENPNPTKLLEILGEKGFSKLEVERFIDLLRQMMDLVESTEQLKKAVKAKIPRGMDMLLKTEQFLTALTCVYSSESKNVRMDFSMKINNGNGKFPNSFQLSYVNAYAVMEPIMNSQTSVVFVSSSCLPSRKILRGELASTDDQENHRQFDETADVIISHQDHTQCFFGYTSKSTNGVTINLNHSNKDSRTLLAEVGEAILTICQKIKNGVIVSVASKKVLEDLIGIMKDGENRKIPIWNKLKTVKHVFSELEFMSKADDAKRQLQLFRECSRSPFGDRNGAILLSLHRGQVNDNMEFEAGEVRAFVSAGIPYHSPNAFNIKTKQEHITKISGESVSKKWYNGEAFYNQNVKFAHCVRKEQDWIVGVILDSRMEGKVKDGDTEFLLPQWMQHQWKGYKDFNKMTNAMDIFLDDK